LQEASFINSKIGWTVGDFGLVLKTTDSGDIWNILCQVTNDNLDFVQFINSELGWATSELNGEIWKTTDGGKSWQKKYNTPDNIKLWQIYFVDEETGWATGEKSTLLITNNGGESWKPQKIGYNDVSIRSINFHSSQEGWLTGKNITLLRTINGGIDWISYERISNSELLYIYFANKQVGWVIGTNGSILFTDNNAGPLPMVVENFSAQLKGNEVSLFWQTSSELNNTGFEIQRRKENGNWYDIIFIDGAGTIRKLRNYNHIDILQSSGTYFYRIKQIGNDGKVIFLDEVKIIYE
jgi:photosystem II stability/assembly factor-like uncharacterized protein